jgi:hypothetical protein
MANVQDLVERYLGAFNETDPTRRRALVNELYDAESTYVDPHVELRGPAQVERFIAETQERFPGFEFRLGGPVDSHHSQARFQWHAGPAGSDEAAYVGFDVIVAEGERLRSVYGFMDAAPVA